MRAGIIDPRLSTGDFCSLLITERRKKQQGEIVAAEQSCIIPE
jgi:hypothetical protein